MNPYEVLAINHDATPRDIIQAAAMALRERKYSAGEVAEARRQLMDPKARLILDFVHFVDIESLIESGEENDSTVSAVILADGTEELERLTIFDSQT